MKRILTFLFATVMLTVVAFAQSGTSPKSQLPNKPGYDVQIPQLFKAPVTNFQPANLHITGNILKADEEAYCGNTTSGTYNSIALSTGAVTPTGSIGSEPFPMAEEFADGTVYRVYNDLTFYSVNPDNGTATMLGTLSGFSGTPTGLAYDWSNSTMYVMMLDGSNLPHLCTLNMSTYALTEIGVGTGMIIGIDFALDGYIYGPALDDDNLYKFDPATGASTLIGATGIDLNYGQDVSYDYITNQLYSITCGGSYQFGTYNLSTGAFTSIADFSDQQIATFVVCNYPSDPAAPAAVSNLVATPDANGALNAVVTWTNPNLDFSGNTLTELTSIDLYLDGALTPEYTNSSPVIGGDENPTITVLNAGMHSFKVFGTNSYGAGIPTTVSVWVGEDVPAEPSNIVLEATGMDANLTWDAPTAGLHGGYFSGTGLTYDVVRYPGGILVSDDQTELTFAETLTDANNYFYEVTPSNAAGEGATGTSNTLVIGDVVFFDFETGLPTNGQLVNGDCGWLFGPNGSSTYFPIPAHGNYAYANDDQCNADMSDVWLILPPVDFTGIVNPYIAFTNVRYYDIFTIKASTDGASWTDVTTLSADNINTWQDENVDLTAYANAPNVFIAFHYNDNGVWGYGWAVDDVMLPGSLVEITCPAPVDIAAITSPGTATISWTETGSATAWNLQYGEAGFTFGEGTTATATTNPQAELTELAAGVYDVYVQADCGGSQSFWAGPFSFVVPNCENSDMCDYVFTLIDDYGDGWNNASVIIFEGDLPVTEITLPDGETNTVNVSLCTGMNISLYFVSGYYDIEVGLTVADPEGTTIATYAVGYFDGMETGTMFGSFTSDCSVSVENIISDNIILYPNPSNGLVTITNAEGASIEVINVMGQVIASFDANSSLTTFDATNLSNGNYVVRIVKDNNTTVKTLNIIK